MSTLEKKIYAVMKIETKARKMKLSAQQDLYQKVDPYFLRTFYSCRGLSENGEVLFSVDIGIKYWRYDELKEGIISPENPIKFTDKVRANSLAMCPCSFPRRTVSFPWDGTDEKLPELCSALLDYITSFQNGFIREAEEQYGGLDAFYIALEKDYPLMAGLTYVERGLFKDAERCFSDSKMPLAHSLISFKAYTEEQVKRLKRDGINLFKHDDYYSFKKSEKQIFIEYARTMQRGCVWTEERLKYGEPL